MKRDYLRFISLALLTIISLSTHAYTVEDFFMKSSGVSISVINDDSYPWTVNDDGVLISNMHTDNGSTTITFTNTSEIEVSCSFEWTSIGEGGCDYIYYSVDGSQKANNSSNQDFIKSTEILQPGQRLSFTYRKDHSATKDPDCAYVKNLSFRSTTDSSGQWLLKYNEDGSCAIKGYNGTATDIVIPSTLEVDAHKYPVTAITGNVFRNNSKITSVVIAESITDIGNNVFYNCDGLKGSITIPDAVTSIGNYAFYDCDGITDIKFPSALESLGTQVFYSCNSLSSVVIPQSLKTIGSEAFYDCSALKKVFNLSSLSISKGSNSYGYIAYYAGNVYKDFEEIDAFRFITDVNGDVKLVDYVGTATTIDLPNDYNGIPYDVANYAFYRKDLLRSVTIPKTVKNIGNYAFSGCTLRSVTFGSGLLSIGSNSFSGITKAIWQTNTPPTNYANANASVNYVPNDQYTNLSNKTIYSFLSSMFTVDGIKFVPVSMSDRTCDAIDCVYDETATSIRIGESVTYRNVAFRVNDVKSHICYDNDNIEEVAISHSGNLNAYAFFDCSNLVDATITNNGYVGNYAFQNCSNMTNCYLGENITSLNTYAFSNCSSLPKLIIPNTVSTIGQYCFQNCTSIPNISIPRGVNNIEHYAFTGCSSLSDVVFDNRETTLTLGSNGSNPLFVDCPIDSVYSK